MVGRGLEREFAARFPVCWPVGRERALPRARRWWVLRATAARGLGDGGQLSARVAEFFVVA